MLRCDLRRAPAGARAATIGLALAALPADLWAQSSGDYRSAASGVWSALATWETFDGASWAAASAAPTPADGAITVRSPHTVTVASNVSADQLHVEPGATLEVAMGVTLTVAEAPGTDLVVEGTLANGGAVSPSAGATIVFDPGSVYRHVFTTTAGTIPAATWSAGAACEIAGYTTNTTPPAGLQQLFGTFRWNCPNQTSAINLGGNLTTIATDLEVLSTGSGSLRMAGGGAVTMSVGRDLRVDSGTLALTSTNGSPVLQVERHVVQNGGILDLQLSGAGGQAELRVRGNVNLAGGSFRRSGSATPKLVMNGVLPQTYASAAALGSGVYVDVAAGASVALLSDLVVAPFTTVTVSGSLDAGAWALRPHTLTVTNGGSCSLGSGNFSQVGSGSLNVNTGGNFAVGAQTLTMASSVSASINVAGTLTVTTGSIGVSGGSNPVNVSVRGLLDLGAGSLTLGTGTLSVFAGGTLDCGTGIVTSTGAASFSLAAGGTLRTASPDGIAASGATGSVQTPSRSFSTGARYVYDAAANQATGTGLPTVVRALTAALGGTLALGASVTADSGVTVAAGTLAFDGRTLRSSTALRVESAGRLQNTSAGQLVLGGGLVNDGEVLLDGIAVGCGEPDSVFIRAAIPGVQQAWSGSGVFAVADANVADQACPAGLVTVVGGTNAGNNSGWIFVLCPTDAAGERFDVLSLAPVAPNPAASMVQVRFALPGAMPATLDLFDVAGRRVRRVVAGPMRAGAHGQAIDTRGLAAGVYLLRLETPAGIRARTLVVAR